MFLPGESFFRAAVEQDPSLHRREPARARRQPDDPDHAAAGDRAWAGARSRSPRAPPPSASSAASSTSALVTFTDHFVALGKKLDGAVQEYNKSVGSFERRVLPQARRFGEHGVTVEPELPSPAPIERAAQPPQTAELPARASEAPPAADAA